MYDLINDLQESGYEIVWQQTLSYSIEQENPNIQVVAAIRVPTEMIENWLGVIKFSGVSPGCASGGFLFKSRYNSREEAKAVLDSVFASASLAGAKVC